MMTSQTSSFAFPAEQNVAVGELVGNIQTAAGIISFLSVSFSYH